MKKRNSKLELHCDTVRTLDPKAPEAAGLGRVLGAIEDVVEYKKPVNIPTKLTCI